MVTTNLTARSATALLVLGLALASPRLAMAETAPATYIVFDGSGSMWGKLATSSAVKFQAAREAIRQGLAKVAPPATVGLAAFGHRRQGDCSDVDIMLAAEAASTDRIMAPLEKLNPKGKGPLVAALKEVAKSAAGATGGGRNARIVLVHDDLDNCQQDVCAAARDIASASPDLVVHVVSLGLKKDDFQRMSCLPKATNGQHFDIQEPGQLAGAFEEAFKGASAVAPRPQPLVRSKQVPATPTAVAPPQVPVGPADDAPPGLYPTAVLSAGQPPLSIDTRWALYAVPRGAAPPLVEGTGAAPHLAAAPGRYTVVGRVGLVERQMEVEIKPSGPTRFSMPLDAAILRFRTAEAATAGRVSARRLLTVADAAAGGRTLWIGAPEPLVVPAGSYRVATGRGTSRLSRDVQAGTGATVDIDLGPALGRLSITAADRDGGPTLAPMLYTVTEDAPDTKTGRREVARSAAPHLDLELPPGTYYVTARHGMAEARDTIAVGPSETLTRTMIMPIARLTVSAKIKGGAGTPPEDATHRILKSDAGAVSEIARAVGPAPEFILPAGRYTIESKIGHQNAIAGADITIAAGEHYRVAVEHTAGEVKLKLVDPRGKFSLADVHWDIRDASDRSVWRTVQREPQAILAAGRYKVRVEARDRRLESAFEVRVGEARRIEITVE